MKHLIRLGLVVVASLWVMTAQAQGLSPRPGSGMGQPPKKTETKEGPAEAAPPETTEEQPDLPALPPWPGQETKKLVVLQLHGYFRFRSDMFHNLNLGLMDTSSLKAPFYNPISEGTFDPTTGLPKGPLACTNRRGKTPIGGGDRDIDEDECPANTLGSANIRLRLEPTINVGEMVRIHTQVDIFDNLVMGSTPDSGTPAVALDAFADSQASPSSGRNSNQPAIVVKRAWADVETPFGPLRFGRMPNHWGMGLVANAGGCWDCNYGDNVDRVMFEATLAGFTLSAAYDFSSTGPTSLSVASGASYYGGGQAVDLEQLDDVDQLVIMAGRIDTEEVIEDKVNRGQLVLNYGLYLAYRQQNFDYGTPSPTSPTTNLGFGAKTDDLSTAFLERHMWTVMPDLWFKLLWKKLYIEFEGVLIAGQIANASNENKEGSYDILQFGWVIRSSYRLLNDSLQIGLEIGMASGDQAEPDNADIDRRRFHPLGRNASGTLIDRDGGLNEFRFDFDYHVDLILFRELLGTVANAVYFKPWAQYMIVDNFGARLDMIYSVAHEAVAFPGNDPNLGIELDVDIFYRNVEERFFAGVQYGILFPLAGLDRPEAIYGARDAASSEIAHTLQARLIVKF